MENFWKKVEKVNDLADVFKALSHPIRVQLIAGLIEKDECNVTNMVKNLNVAQPTISQHINVLKTLGIVKGYRKGNQIYYKLDNDLVRKIYRVL